jgi:hypothetical protein
MQDPLAFNQRKVAEIAAVEFEDIESHEASIAAPPQQIVELRPSLRIAADDLTVERHVVPDTGNFGPR